MSDRARMLLIATVVAALLVAGCGTRRSHDEVAAAAGGAGGDANGFNAASGGSGSGPAAGQGPTATTTPGATTIVDGGTVGGGGTSGDAGTVGGGGGGGGATDPAAAATGPTCPDGPLSPVNVGHIGGYEGLVGATLAGGLETAQIWAKSVNSRGGLNCHPVNLIAVNDRNDPNTNAALVRQLVESKGVIAFVGNLTPLSLGGGLGYLEQRQVPLVGGDLVHPGWLSSSMAFAQGIGTDLGAPASMVEGVRSAQARGLPNPTNAALFVCEVEACTSARGSVTNGGGGTYNLVYSPNISLVQTNFTNECREAAARNVGVVFVGGAGATLEAAANSCADQGYHPQWVTYSLAIQNSLTGNPNLDLTVGASPTFPWMLTDGVGAEYGDALARYAPNLSTSGAASQVWTAGKLLEAAGRNLSANPSSAEIIAGLTALNGDNLGGVATPLSFPNGAAPQRGCYFLVQVAGGAWTAPRGSECIPT